MSKQEPDTRRTGGSTELTLPVRKLSIVNRLGELGVDGVAGRLERLGGGDGVVTEQVACGYADPVALDASFDDDDPRVGVRVSLASAPHGYVLVLFPMSSANNAATMMLSDAVSDLSSVDNDLAHSALVELGAMMASGFMDAWADTFEQQIDVGTPRRIQDTPRDAVARTLRMDSDLGLYVGTNLHLPERGVDATVTVFPDTGTFVKLLRLLELEQVV
jgi:chemotaxis protein CheY-P-specific phosphatase CheC